MPSASLIWRDVVGWLGSRGMLGGGVALELPVLLPDEEEAAADELTTLGA